jgi:hypothetical protein
MAIQVGLTDLDITYKDVIGVFDAVTSFFSQDGANRDKM